MLTDEEKMDRAGSEKFDYVEIDNQRFHSSDKVEIKIKGGDNRWLLATVNNTLDGVKLDPMYGSGARVSSQRIAEIRHRKIHRG